MTWVKQTCSCDSASLESRESLAKWMQPSVQQSVNPDANTALHVLKLDLSKWGHLGNPVSVLSFSSIFCFIRKAARSPQLSIHNAN